MSAVIIPFRQSAPEDVWWDAHVGEFAAIADELATAAVREAHMLWEQGRPPQDPSHLAEALLFTALGILAGERAVGA